MGYNMDGYLVDSNQLRHYRTKVQDNPMLSEPLSIITEDNEFCMHLAMEGTIVYAETNYPTENELQTFPHIML